MTQAIVTKLAKSPFPGKPPAKPKVHKEYTPLSLEKVERCRDPYKPERVVKEHKYNELFSNLQEGDCFKLPVGFQIHELSALARALRLHLKRNGLHGVVRQSARTEDGVGRVWLVRLFNVSAARKAA